MKNVFFIAMGLISSLFATKINPDLPATLQAPPLQYQSHSTEGNRFKIQFASGMTFDACACGCEKDAKEALSRWQTGDEIELYPFAEDAKGFIYLLKNLENSTEVYSWIKTPPPSTSDLPKFTSRGKLPNTFYTSDGNRWLLTADVNIDSWKKGDRIFSCSNAFLHPSEFILINFDNAKERHIKAFHFNLEE